MQSGGVAYRFYDWDRLSGAAAAVLHLLQERLYAGLEELAAQDEVMLIDLAKMYRDE